MINDELLERYSRHILLPQVGIPGQEKILQSKVLIIGTGGLGAPIALYLAAAGVGTLGLADADVVDLSNLQRQIIHFTPDIGKSKVLSAAEKITKINPDVKIIPFPYRIQAENIREVIADFDFIVDGTDNFPSKFLINDACVLTGKAYSHGGILRFTGQTLTHIPGSACYRCAFPTPPPKNAVPTCSQAGVLGAVAGILGTIQAAEVLKYITGAGELLTNRLHSFDALSMTFRQIPLKRNDFCPICGTHPTINEIADEEPAVCDLIQRKRELLEAGQL